MIDDQKRCIDRCLGENNKLKNENIGKTNFVNHILALNNKDKDQKIKISEIVTVMLKLGIIIENK